MTSEEKQTSCPFCGNKIGNGDTCNYCKNKIKTQEGNIVSGLGTVHNEKFNCLKQSYLYLFNKDSSYKDTNNIKNDLEKIEINNESELYIPAQWAIALIAANVRLTADKSDAANNLNFVRAERDSNVNLNTFKKNQYDNYVKVFKEIRNIPPLIEKTIANIKSVYDSEYIESLISECYNFKTGKIDDNLKATISNNDKIGENTVVVYIHCDSTYDAAKEYAKSIRQQLEYRNIKVFAPNIAATDWDICAQNTSNTFNIAYGIAVATVTIVISNKEAEFASVLNAFKSCSENSENFIFGTDETQVKKKGEIPIANPDKELIGSLRTIKENSKEQKQLLVCSANDTIAKIEDKSNNVKYIEFDSNTKKVIKEFDSNTKKVIKEREKTKLHSTILKEVYTAFSVLSAQPKLKSLKKSNDMAEEDSGFAQWFCAPTSDSEIAQPTNNKFSLLNGVRKVLSFINNPSRVVLCNQDGVVGSTAKNFKASKNLAKYIDSELDKKCSELDKKGEARYEKYSEEIRQLAAKKIESLYYDLQANFSGVDAKQVEIQDLQRELNDKFENRFKELTNDNSGLRNEFESSMNKIFEEFANLQDNDEKLREYLVDQNNKLSLQVAENMQLLHKIQTLIDNNTQKTLTEIRNLAVVQLRVEAISRETNENVKKLIENLHQEELKRQIGEKIEREETKSEIEKINKKINGLYERLDNLYKQTVSSNGELSKLTLDDARKQGNICGLLYDRELSNIEREAKEVIEKGIANDDIDKIAGLITTTENRLISEIRQLHDEIKFIANSSYCYACRVEDKQLLKCPVCGEQRVSSALIGKSRPANFDRYYQDLSKVKLWESEGLLVVKAESNLVTLANIQIIQGKDCEKVRKILIVVDDNYSSSNSDNLSISISAKSNDRSKNNIRDTFKNVEVFALAKPKENIKYVLKADLFDGCFKESECLKPIKLFGMQYVQNAEDNSLGGLSESLAKNYGFNVPGLNKALNGKQNG